MNGMVLILMAVIVIGLFALWFVWPRIARPRLQKRIRLEPGSIVIKDWWGSVRPYKGNRVQFAAWRPIGRYKGDGKVVVVRRADVGRKIETEQWFMPHWGVDREAIHREDTEDGEAEI